MKKTLRIIAFSCIAITGCIMTASISSCSRDDGDVTLPVITNQIEQETGLRLCEAGMHRYSYDQSGRCINIDNWIKIDWKKKVIRVLGSGSEKTLHFTTNAKGYIIELSQSGKHSDDPAIREPEITVFSYNEYDHLTEIYVKSTEKIDGHYGDGYIIDHCQYALTWENGNLIEVKQHLGQTIIDGAIYGGQVEDNPYIKFDITYGPQINKYNQWCQIFINSMLQHCDYITLANIGVLGKGSTNLPIKVSYYPNWIEYPNEFEDWSVNISTNQFDLIEYEEIYDKRGTRSYSYRYTNARGN